MPRRIAAIGQSATVALIYLSLIDGLPAASRRLERRRPPRQARSAVPRAGRVRGLRASAGSRAPRVLFSCAADPGARPALLRRAGACLPAASAAPARIPRRAQHRRHPRAPSRRRGRAQARCTPPIRPSASLLGPPRPPLSPPALLAGLRAGRPAATISPIPFAGCAGVCAHLPSCAICAEIADARAEWLAWLAGASENATPRYRMCCRCAAITSGRRAPWPARHLRRRSPQSSWREAEQRLAFAADAALACRGSRRLLDRLACAFGASRGRTGRAAPLWHRCAAAASARSARVSARPASALCRWSRRWSKVPTGAALSRAAMVCASAMRRRRWRCRTHPPSATSSRTRPMPGWRCCAGSWRSSCGAAPGRPGRQRRGVESASLAQGRRAFCRHHLGRPIDGTASATHLLQ